MSGEKIASRGQLLQLAGMLAQDVPTDLPGDVAQKWIDNPSAMREAVRSMLWPQWVKTFQGLLATCKQDEVDYRFNEGHFSLEPVAPNEDDWEVHEHFFSASVDGLKAFGALEQLGNYQPCGPRRAMTFIATHLHDQLENDLVVTTRWYWGVNWWTPVFCGNGSKRILKLQRLNRKFGPCDGWLVLRRKQA